jgi:hypothetical protein
VPRIRRPAVAVEISLKALELGALYRLVVTLFAGALDRPAKEQLAIAAVRGLMVRDDGDAAFPLALARLAPGHAIELRFAPEFPGLCVIPFPPGLGLPALLIGGLARDLPARHGPSPRNLKRKITMSHAHRKPHHVSHAVDAHGKVDHSAVASETRHAADLIDAGKLQLRNPSQSTLADGWERITFERKLADDLVDAPAPEGAKGHA